MSRRTKLTLLISLLIAFAAAIGYFLLAPQPENPLRFRLAGLQASSSAVIRFYDVTIENTSDVPIHVYSTYLIREHGPRAGESGDDLGTMLNVDGGTIGFLVPPHGRIQGSVLVDPPSMASVEGGKMHINYFWKSNARHALEEGYRNLMLYLPSAIRPSLDTEFFESSGHSTALEPMVP